VGDPSLAQYYGFPNNTGVCVPPRPTGPLQTLSTVAGTGALGLYDGPAAMAVFNDPRYVAMTPAGDIYIGDRGNQVTRKISPAGTVSTINVGGTGVTISPLGIPYVSSEVTHSIYRLDPGDIPVRIAGTGEIGTQDGPANQAQFSHPYGLAVAKDGTIFVADKYNCVIRRIGIDGMVSTFAGSSTNGPADGIGSAAQFQYPEGLALTPTGILYVGDKYNHKIRRITPAGVVTTIMGTGAVGNDDGPALSATLTYPLQVALDPWGTLYIADEDLSTVRTLTPDGQTHTLIRDYGFADGPLPSAHAAYTSGVWATADGRVLVGDSGNFRVRIMTR
jgi:serine/threonine protein kinase, bacterial